MKFSDGLGRANAKLGDLAVMIWRLDIPVEERETLLKQIVEIQDGILDSLSYLSRELTPGIYS